MDHHGIANYLSTGKRSILEAHAQALVNDWSKRLGLSVVPVVKATRAGRSRYRYGRHLITLGTGLRRGTRVVDAEKWAGTWDARIMRSLIHEFAHHVNHILWTNGGHNFTFRTALVVTATLAYGDPRKYAWGAEYQTVRAWARRQGLLPKEEKS